MIWILCHPKRSSDRVLSGSVWRALRHETQSNRESMRPLWFFHLHILSSATTALSTSCQGRLYPHIYFDIYIHIYTHTYKFRKKAAQANTKKLSLSRKLKIFFPFQGPVRESNPGPLAPEARIIPLDQQAETSYDKRKNYIWRIPFPYVTNISVTSVGLQFTDL